MSNEHLNRDIPKFVYETSCSRPDYHAVVTVQLCELIDDGFFDLSREDWDFPKYTPEQHKQLCDKITAHYYYREISIVPPGIWKREFLRKMGEIMPKYIPLYKLMEEMPELYGGTSEWYKSRNIYSDFPQTQLNGENGDYASTGADMEFQRIKQEDIIDLVDKLQDYRDIDLLIIDDIEDLFSSLYTVNMSSF